MTADHPHPLDTPARSALLGPHARFATRRGEVLRYPAQMCPFVALPDLVDDNTWADVAALLGPGGVVPVAGLSDTPPAGWDTVFDGPGVQLAGDQVAGAPFPRAVRLGRADVPEMLALVERTQPGPFFRRTVEMGTYLGVRHDGELVAMAGERLHPTGWTEISAVCTDAAFRGRGYGTQLVLAVAAGIRSRGELPFLHASARNTDAIRLYLGLGFTWRRDVSFRAVRVPAA